MSSSSGRETFNALVEGAREHYTHYETSTEDGMTWHFVGRNATHDFEVAIDADGMLWLRTTGESADGGFETDVHKCAEGHIPYVGHY